MAKSEAMIWKATSGTVGKELTITKKRSGNIQIGKHRKPSSVAPTENQLEVQQRFSQSAVYAKAAMTDPDLKAQYQAAVKKNKDQSAYNLALRDAYKAPEITTITTAVYTGNIGSTIIVRAVDDFRVAAVKVQVINAVGVIIEKGDAVLQANGMDWIYTATVANDPVQGSTITVTAFDLPGNEAIKEVVV